MISIHALREERDHRYGKRHHKNQISIHALREERDGRRKYLDVPDTGFQSTRSARSATL